MERDQQEVKMFWVFVKPFAQSASVSQYFSATSTQIHGSAFMAMEQTVAKELCFTIYLMTWGRY